jgi:hypothetical protein
MSTGQARSIKLSGDKLREFFKNQCTNDSGLIHKELLVGLTNQNKDGTYVLKSGSNWQFHLGSFSPFVESWGVQFSKQGKQVIYQQSHEKIISDFRSDSFINSFIVKGNFFCVYDAPNWLIFDSQDIKSLLMDSAKLNWRILESGRIKGDVNIANLKRAIFTLEYRAEVHKRQFVFGAHGGGAGDKLKNILKESMFFNSIPVDYELWKENLKSQ